MVSTRSLLPNIYEIKCDTDYNIWSVFKLGIMMNFRLYLYGLCPQNQKRRAERIVHKKGGLQIMSRQNQHEQQQQQKKDREIETEIEPTQ